MDILSFEVHQTGRARVSYFDEKPFNVDYPNGFGYYVHDL